MDNPTSISHPYQVQFFLFPRYKEREILLVLCWEKQQVKIVSLLFFAHMEHNIIKRLK